MTIRTRKFFGTIALLVLVVVWSLLGMTIAQTPWLANSGLLQAIFYVVAGLGWVLPAMPIISWMSRPDRAGVGRVLIERAMSAFEVPKARRSHDCSLEPSPSAIVRSTGLRRFGRDSGPACASCNYWLYHFYTLNL